MTKFVLKILKDQPYYIGLILWWIILICICLTLYASFRILSNSIKKYNKGKGLKYSEKYKSLLHKLSNDNKLDSNNVNNNSNNTSTNTKDKNK